MCVDELEKKLNYNFHCTEYDEYEVEAVNHPMSSLTNCMYHVAPPTSSPLMWLSGLIWRYRFLLVF